MTYLVTGATGTVGRQVIDHLLAAGDPVRALTRDPARAELPAGVEVVGGDLDQPATLTAALEGATAVHLIAFGSAGPLADIDGLVAAVRDAGVARCTVLVDWDDQALVPALTAAGVPTTLVAPVEFMANKLDDWGDAARADGVIHEVVDRAGPLVHETDVGAVAAVALRSDAWVGQQLTLTGPQALRPSEQVAILAEATGRPLRFEQLEPDAAAERWRQAGVPEEVVAFKLELASYDIGEYAEVNDTVERVLGRPATSFRAWAEMHADAFR